MKKIHIYLFVALCAFSACTRNFDEINTDPNNPTRVEPDFLLTNAILRTMNLYGGDMNRVVFFNYTHHYSGFQGEFQRYTFNQASNNTYWKNTYIDCLQPVKQIALNYKDNPAYRNRVAIAGIWQCFILSNAVATWGSVPKTHALNGEPSVPYDKEEDIYYALLDELKTLAAAIDPAGDTYAANADKVYGGNLQQWKKFANTLRLRLAMRISNAAPNGNPDKAREVVAEIFADQQSTITTQAETAAAQWGASSDTWNPLYNYAVYNSTANKATIPVLNESLVYHTLPYQDPRLGVYGKPAAQGPQAGRFFGQNISYGGGSQYASGQQVNPHTGLKQEDYSQIGERFTKPDAEYVFLSYAEACFLKSEAALKGWWGTPEQAEQWYYQGIDASFNRYGLSTAQAAAYKATPGIRWGTAADTTGRQAEFEDWLGICSSYVPAGDHYRQIVMQHWLAIPMQGIDAWTLIRRTRLLEFQPQFATYDGDYKYVPQRILYPSEEYQANPGEVNKAAGWLQGADDLYTKLWFALPQVKNPFLPY
ncbi:SusD/RagB family nutrient-binding outer membrane lipoprotein [Chitinophaga sp.]|uniref:SusD/RagB family nutrient-binding outer membrane lipoprotein n=1 Tax=Chitinophaga sp. TaxID=1869181 RepID=UPI0031D49E31